MVAHMPATVLTGAKLLDGVVTNVLITDGTITAIGDDVEVPAGAETVDLTGYVLLPAAVEPHAHLDKAFLAELVVNETGDLYGAIEAMTGSRHLTNVADTIERAERAARLMARQRLQRRAVARRHHPGEPARRASRRWSRSGAGSPT